MNTIPIAVHLTDDQSLAYALDALDTAERAAIEAHVAACPDCAATLRAAHASQAALFALFNETVDAQPPGRNSDWSIVRDRIIARPRGYVAAWRWAAGAIGGLSAPFLFAVGFASAAGIGYAALPPLRHAVDRALGRTVATTTATPTVVPTARAVAGTPSAADAQTSPAPAADGTGGHAGHATRSADAQSSLDAAPSATPTTMPLASPTASPTPPSDAPAAAVGPAGRLDPTPTTPSDPTAEVAETPAPTDVPPLQLEIPTNEPPVSGPGGPGTPGPAHPGRPGRPGGPPGPPRPGPRPTEVSGTPPATPSSEMPPRRSHGRGHEGPPDRGHLDPTPEPSTP
ncbi:MAG: zf-HC2 domain-containing protein [Ardenticatenales bacterium]